MFFEIIHSDIKINFDKNSSDNLIDNSIFKKYDILKNKFYSQKFNNFTNKIINIENTIFNNSNYFLDIFNINFNDSIFIRADFDDNKLNYYIEQNNKKYNILSYNKKTNSIIQNNMSESMYNFLKNKNNCDTQNFLNEYILNCITYFFDILNINGNVFFTFFNYCDIVPINIIYLLSSMFKKIIIYEGNYIYCSHFLNNNSSISKNDILKCIQNKTFNLDNRPNLDQFVKYLNDIFIYKNNLLTLFIDEKYDEYIDIKLNEMYNILLYRKVDKDILEFFYKKIINILKRSFINNKLINVHSSIKELEGNFISDVIQKYKFKKCLEVGMAFGISAFYILSNKFTKLISIDPNQSTQWNNNGINLLKEFNYSDRHKCIQKKSYEALPQLLKKKGEKYFDFIFIDGWHTFDYTLVDFFYSNLLLKIGSIIIIDDALHDGVKVCVNYLNSNYTFFKKLESPNTVACYQKISDDNRDWNFHKFF